VAFGNPELALGADNLGALKDQLSADDFDQAVVGRLLADLADQVQRFANSDIQIEVANQLSQLSVLFSREDDPSRASRKDWPGRAIAPPSQAPERYEGRETFPALA
jgi:hypothetical protein